MQVAAIRQNTRLVMAAIFAVSLTNGFRQAQAAPVRLFASQFAFPANFYSINPSTAAGTVIGNTQSYVPGMDFRSNGVLYGSENSLHTINVSTGIATTIAPLADLMVSIAFSPNDELFAVNNSGTALFKVNPVTGTTIARVPLSAVEINGIDFAPDGTLYGIADALYRINPSTGVITRITPPGVFLIPGGGVFDDMDYGADGLVRAVSFDINQVNSQLYTINPATGLSISIAATHLNLDGLASIPEPSTFALAAFGLINLVAWGWRRKQSRAVC